MPARAPAGAGEQPFATESRIERLDAEPTEQRMLGAGARSVGVGPEDGAEATRIVQPQHGVAEVEVEVIVRGRWLAGATRAQRAAHPEVDDQRPFAEVEHQVLRSALDRSQSAPGQAAIEVRRNRPAQVGPSRHHGPQFATDEALGQAATDDFDFGQFGHGSGSRPDRRRLRQVRRRAALIRCHAP